MGAHVLPGAAATRGEIEIGIDRVVADEATDAVDRILEQADSFDGQILRRYGFRREAGIPWPRN